MIVAGKIDYIPVEYHWLLLRQVMRKINQASDNVKGNLIQIVRVIVLNLGIKCFHASLLHFLKLFLKSGLKI